jgi:GNAT superfamily N-acetyltransferase
MAVIGFGLPDRLTTDQSPPPCLKSCCQADCQRAGEWEALIRAYSDFYKRTLEPAAADRAWAAFVQESVMHALGARLGGRLVGVAHFLRHASTTAGDVCYLQDLFTAPHVRGQGVGRALIASVVEWARGRGCSRVYWSTHDSNATARRLYDHVAVNNGFIRYVIEL